MACAYVKSSVVRSSVLEERPEILKQPDQLAWAARANRNRPVRKRVAVVINYNPEDFQITLKDNG
jgi:hypothetical protein